MSRLLAAEVAKTITMQEKWEQCWNWSQPLQWTTNLVRTPETLVRQVQRAAPREEFYRSIIRYWRKFHVMLALVTVGLVAWHLVFVVQLMVFHMG
ncbi:MAG TPA: hypothetical protein VNG51_20255 [Ktedonobacteraceae bacterium]|nr:hypothetical protein [Ktedonobacteraceae bacterium]